LTASTVIIRELVGWDLDEYSYRDQAAASSPELRRKIERANSIVAQQAFYGPCNALLKTETERAQHLFLPHAQRSDLRREYNDLNWEFGVVDLRSLLAFQRRLVFDPSLEEPIVPDQGDWPGLISLSLGAPRNTAHTLSAIITNPDHLEVSLQSNNPDLALRISTDNEDIHLHPISLYGGSPFLEVAELRERWFLRDGYHRAYRLLQAGIHRIPAIVIHARTIEEVGATQPWFFDESQLFSSAPPRLTDFLDENLVFCYERPRLKKIIRIRIEESLQQIDE
jgi:hypothetical protein